MATKPQTIEFILDQLSGVEQIRARKMFGEYALYCQEKVVALVCDDELFVKPTTAGQVFLGSPTLKPPYPGAKDYFYISGDRLDDRDWLAELIQKTTAEVPVPKKKK